MMASSSRTQNAGVDVTRSLPTSNRTYNNVTMNDVTSRLDAVAKVTGRAKYGIDYTSDPAPLVAGFARCPWGKARLDGGSIETAKEIPGVVHAEWVGSGPGRECTYHGQKVAVVVAESIDAMRQGRAALGLVWHRLDCTHDIDSAQPDPPELSQADQEAVNRALDGADFIIDVVYSTAVQTHSCLETHGAMVHHQGQRAVVYGSTQSNFGFRDGLQSKDALNLPVGSIEMHCEYVGGGFGSKLGPGPEGQTAARFSRQFGRPVWLFCDRGEEHLDTGNRPSSRQHYQLGIRKDGTITGGHILTCGGVGVAGGGGGVSGQRYDFGQVVRKHVDVPFNGGAPKAMRAPGHPQGMFAAELAMDELTAAAGIDPLELRLMHDPSAFRKGMYGKGAELIGWSNRKPNGSQRGPIKIGYGMGISDWPNIRVPGEAEVMIHRDGSVEARSGTQDMGQGQRTVMGVVAAHHLGVPLSFIQVKVGCTDYPPGPASGGSMTTTNTEPAMRVAATEAKKQLLARVAEEKGLSADDLHIVDGAVVTGSGQTIADWQQACAMLTGPITVHGSVGRSDPELRGEGNSEGVQFVKVEVDCETGVVRVLDIVAIQSCGIPVCRKTAESQIIGGVIQGISYALFENRLLDRQTGAMVNANFEQYKIAGADDMPRIVPILWQDPNATGTRGLGEPPTIPTSGAIACAVFNAVGAPVRSTPITPDRVLDAVARAQAASEGGA